MSVYETHTHTHTHTNRVNCELLFCKTFCLAVSVTMNVWSNFLQRSRRLAASPCIVDLVISHAWYTIALCSGMSFLCPEMVIGMFFRNNWSLTSCQPQKVSSRRSNSVISKYMFKSFFHIICKLFPNRPYANIKQDIRMNVKHKFWKLFPC